VFPGPAEFATAWRDSVRAVIRSISRGTTGATVSVCLHDPGGNGIELYFDRSRHLWFDGQGRAVLEAEHIAARG
jgi:catechol-2,3-dioxygenase